jgi:hypothetical protein
MISPGATSSVVRSKRLISNPEAIYPMPRSATSFSFAAVVVSAF